MLFSYIYGSRFELHPVRHPQLPASLRFYTLRAKTSGAASTTHALLCTFFPRSFPVKPNKINRLRTLCENDRGGGRVHTSPIQKFPAASEKLSTPARITMIETLFQP